MKQQTLQLYEGMYVLGAYLGEEARKTAFLRIQDQITSRGGEIHKIHEQGRKRLAYEIHRHREGYYYVMYFSIDPSQLDDLMEEYRRTEDLLRYLVFRTDKVCEEIKFKKLPEV